MSTQQADRSLPSERPSRPIAVAATFTAEPLEDALAFWAA